MRKKRATVFFRAATALFFVGAAIFKFFGIPATRLNIIGGCVGVLCIAVGITFWITAEDAEEKRLARERRKREADEAEYDALLFSPICHKTAALPTYVYCASSDQDFHSCERLVTAGKLKRAGPRQYQVNVQRGTGGTYGRSTY